MTAPLRTYLPGCPSWVDVMQRDPAAGQAFYGELFGWTFEPWPTSDPYDYYLAYLDGLLAAGMSTRPEAPAWRTYVTVDDLEATTDAAVQAGAERVLLESAGSAGRWSQITDPQGASLGFWEPGQETGAQAFGIPGSWSFTALRTSAPTDAIDWYSDLLGWESTPAGEIATMLQVPGYGAHRARTADPDIYQRYPFAPERHPDAVAWVSGGSPHPAEAIWTIAFTVADRNASAELAVRLGGRVLDYHDTAWTRGATIEDPQGAVFHVTEVTPPPLE